jgi:hypothetical protein
MGRKIRVVGTTVLLCALIAVIASIVWKRSMRQKQLATLQSLGGLREVLHDYKTEFGVYPDATGEPLSEAIPDLKSFAQKHHVQSTIRFVDAWNNHIYILSSENHYVVWSNGADGQPDAVRPGGAVEDFDRDIIMADQEFWQRPTGKGGPPPSNPDDPFERVLRERNLERQTSSPSAGT